MSDTKYHFSTEINVRDYELDSEGIVNNANYQHYLEHARHLFMQHAGYSFGEMVADGLTPVVSRVEINYKHSLRSGDTALCKIRLERKGVRFLFHQDIFNKATGEQAIGAIVTTVVLKNGMVTRGDMLAEKFAKYLND